jgi:hypothetical protein
VFPVSWKVLLAYGIGSLALDAVSNPQTVLPLALAPWTPPLGLSLAFLLLYGLHYAPLLIGVTFLAGLPIYGHPPTGCRPCGPPPCSCWDLVALAAWLLRGLGIDPNFPPSATCPGSWWWRCWAPGWTRASTSSPAARKRPPTSWPGWRTW